MVKSWREIKQLAHTVFSYRVINVKLRQCFNFEVAEIQILLNVNTTNCYGPFYVPGPFMTKIVQHQKTWRYPRYKHLQ